MALRDGQMSWADVMAGPLAGATCLWQDLDGMHVEPAPAVAPPTSILWAWRCDELLVRLRLEGRGARYEQVVTSGPNPVTSVGPAPDA